MKGEASSVWCAVYNGLRGSAYAADYPTKPVTLMVAYPAGGETDIGARIVAAIAEKDLGQPIIVVNKGGAGGQIGWTELARQKGDGYYHRLHQSAGPEQHHPGPGEESDLRP